MAVPAVHPPSRPDAGPINGLLEHALHMLADHLSAPGGDRPWRFGPLVVVSPAEDAASAAIRSVLAGRHPGAPAVDVARWHGTALDRELATAVEDDRLDRFAVAVAGRRLVVIDRIDRVVHPERRRALVHVLDVAAAAGSAWCVSVPRPPDDDLGPQGASRLAGGLVVAGPRDAAARPAAAPDLRTVIRAAGRHLDVPIGTLLGPARSRSVTVARSVAMYLARRLTGLSFQAIGVACGGRDHTTVMHGVRVCAARIGRDPVFAADVERLAADLTAAKPVPTRRRLAVGSVPLDRVRASRRGAPRTDD